MAPREGSQDYYTGDLEKRFNYFWDYSNVPTTMYKYNFLFLPVGHNPWLCFVHLVDANPSTPAIRYLFYTSSGRRTVMSRGAYYRWVRSLHAKRKSEVT